MDCQLSFVGEGEQLPDGWWQISVTDNPDQAGALGYHELTSRGTPLGKVFAGLDLQSGASWTVTLSHELLEMLADPWINWCAQGANGKIYALEVCDAVEADKLGYDIDGVLVSDFITPSWFEPTHGGSSGFHAANCEAARARLRRLHVGVRCEQRVDADCSPGRARASNSFGKQEAAAQPGKGGVEKKSAAPLAISCASAPHPW